MKIIEKGRVKGSYRCMKTKTLEKNLRENDKNLDFEFGSVEERERDRAFWKVWIVKNTWKTQVLKNSLNDFRLIENYIQLIQQWSSIDRARQLQTKFLIAISIGWATSSIDRKSRKIKFLKNRAILCRNSSKHSISWMKCMSMRLKVFQKPLNLTQIFQKQNFHSNCPQITKIRHILH